MSVRWLAICFLWFFIAVLGGCQKAPTPPPFKSSAPAPYLSFIQPQGPIAEAQRIHLFKVTGLVFIFVIGPVVVGAPFLAWRYRYTGSTRYTPKWSFWWPLEVATWGGPIAIVICLSVWLVYNVQKLDPYAPLAAAGDPPLRVDVVGYDWKWLFIYPQYNIASIGEVAFPAGRPLSIVLTSDTVMQSFFISALGSQIYAMPGMITRLHLLANAPGRFRGENTQYNGNGFYQQNFVATAMTQDDFKAWVKRVQTTGIPLSPKAYAAVAQRSTLSQTRQALGADPTPDAPLLFADVSSNLFDTIVHSFKTGMPPEARGTGLLSPPPSASGH